MINRNESILIASGKGGVGKSSFTSNLAYTLADDGYKVCIVDLDISLGKQDIFLGLEDCINHDIYDVIKKRCTINESIVKDKRNDNLYLLSAPKNDNNIKINEQELKQVLDDLKEAEFDIILLDCPTGISNDFFNSASKCCDRAIIITNPERTSLRDADSVVSILENNNFSTSENIHLIINKYIKPKTLTKKCFINVDEIQKTLAIPLLGVINYNINNSYAINKGEPIVISHQKTNQDYKAIHKKLIKIIQTNES